MGLRQLSDVENDADSQIELPEDGPQLWDQIELHDLTQQGMEEKKRKDKEAAERMKMEEEKDDKRQVEGMAMNQRRYEDEEERRLAEERPGLKRGCEEEEKKRTEVLYHN
ncbi:hypothetical protein KUCAC02_034803 [Chaenocephalus aceratus]|nr:hypothetical protein KUCAC02_034803 [Chaenocephalus aceratus]